MMLDEKCLREMKLLKMDQFTERKHGKQSWNYDDLNKLANVDELAAILNVPKTWIYERTRQGQKAIPFIRLGAYVRFQPAEVIKFFQNKEDGVS